MALCDIPALEVAWTKPSFCVFPNPAIVGPPLAHNHERCPVGWVRFLPITLIDHAQHRQAHSLRTAHGLARGKPLHRARDEFHRRIGVDLPVRDEKRAGLGVKERAGANQTGLRRPLPRRQRCCMPKGSPNRRQASGRRSLRQRDSRHHLRSPWREG